MQRTKTIKFPLLPYYLKNLTSCRARCTLEAHPRSNVALQPAEKGCGADAEIRGSEGSFVLDDTDFYLPLMKLCQIMSHLKVL